MGAPVFLDSPAGTAVYCRSLAFVFGMAVAEEVRGGSRRIEGERRADQAGGEELRVLKEQVDKMNKALKSVNGKNARCSHQFSPCQLLFATHPQRSFSGAGA
mgnify:CR=1 FL=1